MSTTEPKLICLRLQNMSTGKGRSNLKLQVYNLLDLK
jgi:hypothetical protein